MWKIFDTGIASAQQNMAWDELLLKEAHRFDTPVIHHYQWQTPAFTHGYFVQPNEVLDMEAISKRGIDFARRCTGGGVIFHGADFAFSILVPARHVAYSNDTLENYRYINTIIAGAIDAFLGRHATSLLPQDYQEEEACRRFCLARPTRYDILLDGKKVGGAAQRRTKDAFLHQGSVSLAPFPYEDIAPLLRDPSVATAMLHNSTSLLAEASCLADTRNALRQFITLLVTGAEFGVKTASPKVKVL